MVFFILQLFFVFLFCFFRLFSIIFKSQISRSALLPQTKCLYICSGDEILEAEFKFNKIIQNVKVSKVVIDI